MGLGYRTEYNGCEIILNSDTGMFECVELSMKAGSLEALKKKMNATKTDANILKNIPVLLMDGYGSGDNFRRLSPYTATRLEGISQCWVKDKFGNRKKVDVSRLFLPNDPKVSASVRIQKEHDEEYSALMQRRSKALAETFPEKMTHARLRSLSADLAGDAEGE